MAIFSSLELVTFSFCSTEFNVTTSLLTIAKIKFSAKQVPKFKKRKRAKRLLII
jgi:hypothetical protein